MSEVSVTGPTNDEENSVISENVIISLDIRLLDLVINGRLTGRGIIQLLMKVKASESIRQIKARIKVLRNIDEDDEVPMMVSVENMKIPEYDESLSLKYHLNLKYKNKEGLPKVVLMNVRRKLHESTNVSSSAPITQVNVDLPGKRESFVLPIKETDTVLEMKKNIVRKAKLDVEIDHPKQVNLYLDAVCLKNDECISKDLKIMADSRFSVGWIIPPPSPPKGRDQQYLNVSSSDVSDGSDSSEVSVTGQPTNEQENLVIPDDAIISVEIRLLDLVIEGPFTGRGTIPLLMKVKAYESIHRIKERIKVMRSIDEDDEFPMFVAIEDTSIREYDEFLSLRYHLNLVYKNRGGLPKVVVMNVRRKPHESTNVSSSSLITQVWQVTVDLPGKRESFVILIKETDTVLEIKKNIVLKADLDDEIDHPNQVNLYLEGEFLKNDGSSAKALRLMADSRMSVGWIIPPPPLPEGRDQQYSNVSSSDGSNRPTSSDSL